MGDDSSPAARVSTDTLMTEERIRHILTARADVRKARNRIIRARIETDEVQLLPLVREGSRELYRGRVETYFTEIEPLLSATDAGAELWREREFGEMEIRPPVEHQRGGARVTVDGTGKQLRGPVPRPKKVELTGLVSLLNLPAPISANWTVETKSVGFQGTEQTREVVTATKEIPFNVTDEMYRAANRYLNELGLGPTLESTRIVNFSREPDGSRLNGDGDKLNGDGDNE